jgi:predicted membrane protein
MLAPNFTALVEPSSILAFFLGVFVTLIFYFAKDKLADKTDPRHIPHRHAIRSSVFVWAIVALGIVYVGTESQRAHNATLQLSKDTLNCERQFNAAITERDMYTQELDDSATQERNALSGWLISLLKPPPNIAKLDYNDPVRQQFGIDATNAYLGQLADIERERDTAKAKLNATPLPAMTCGK